jgi:hypothetical protein
METSCVMVSENATKTISSSKQDHYSDIRRTEHIAATATAIKFTTGIKGRYNKWEMKDCLGGAAG